MKDKRGHRVLDEEGYRMLSDSQKKLYMEIRDRASRLFTRNKEFKEVIEFLLSEMEIDKQFFNSKKGHYSYLKEQEEMLKPLNPR